MLRWIRIACIIYIMTTKHVSLFALLCALMLSLSSAVSAQPTADDLLLYYDRDRESPGITAFNPSTGEKIELPVFNAVDEIRTSGDGRLAYMQDNDVWVLYVLNAPYSPINITETPDEQELHLTWTPDGSLLQYQVGSNSGPFLLYEYNGIAITVVASGYTLKRHWNESGWYVAPSEHDDEISWYVWNGVTVAEVNNPSGDETFMLGDWSADGRLTLYTSQDYSDRWYLWDGISFTSNGIPDTSTLAEINGPTETINDLEWMPDGRLAIVAEGDPESDSLLGHSFLCADPCVPQLYLWTPQSLQQVTSNDFGGLLVDVHDSGSIAVSDFDGLRVWGVTVYDTNLQSVFQSDEIQYTSPLWSTGGDLAYCKSNDLFIWDGQENVQVSSYTDFRWLIAPSSSSLCFTG